MKVLVTGVPGWLGNCLLGQITKDSFFDSVRCLTLPEMAQSLKEYGCEVIAGDIRNQGDVERAAKGMDVIMHLCGLIHPNRLNELFEINTQGTKNVIAAAVKSGTQRIVYISSNAPGGMRRDHQLMTEADVPQPYLAYGKSKYLAEQALLEVNHSGNVETVILRPCWFYGPGQPARQTRFFKMIAAGNPIMFGNGSNLRSLSYVDNTVQALLLAAKTKKAAGNIYWIADEKPYPTIEIYQTVAKLLGVKNFRPRFLPGIVSECCMVADYILQSIGLYQQEIHVAGEMNKNIACSIEKARKELGYQPQVGLEDGMMRSIEWCRRQGLL